MEVYIYQNKDSIEIRWGVVDEKKMADGFRSIKKGERLFGRTYEELRRLGNVKIQIEGKAK